MGGITIEELGMKFVDACMKLYWGPCWYPVLFAIGLIATLIWGRKKSSMIFIGCTAVLFLTVYNPVVVKYIIAKLGFDQGILPLYLAASGNTGGGVLRS